jgi:2-methylfumaryl-CoA isomerase
MYRFLQGLRVVEGAAFIAAPSCGLYLSQLGAEVIRFDMIGGGPDFGRWPKAANGASLYWEGLNKGKKSIALDLGRPEGRELAVRLIVAPGPGSGVFLTNFPASGFLSYKALAEKRADLIVVRVMGTPDEGPAVDYTVNAAIGVPQMTGPASLGEAPVNHVLPAWDIATGAYAAFALLAADRHRQATGQGQEVRIPLSDVALATLGNIGQVAEAELSGRDRPRYGNDLFGAFGRDFATRDGQRIMLVAITPRQWTGLINVLGIGAEIDAVEKSLGISFAKDEGLRFEHRERLNPIVARAVAARDRADLAPAFDKAGVCWGSYGALHDKLAEPNPLLTRVTHGSGQSYLTPGPAAAFGAGEREAPRPAPRLGEHTDEVLSTCLGLSGAEIARLHDRKIVAGPTRA